MVGQSELLMGEQVVIVTSTATLPPLPSLVTGHRLRHLQPGQQVCRPLCLHTWMTGAPHHISSPGGKQCFDIFSSQLSMTMVETVSKP